MPSQAAPQLQAEDVTATSWEDVLAEDPDAVDRIFLGDDGTADPFFRGRSSAYYTSCYPPYYCH